MNQAYNEIGSINIMLYYFKALPEFLERIKSVLPTGLKPL